MTKLKKVCLDATKEQLIGNYKKYQGAILRQIHLHGSSSSRSYKLVHTSHQDGLRKISICDHRIIGHSLSYGSCKNLRVIGGRSSRLVLDAA